MSLQEMSNEELTDKLIEIVTIDLPDEFYEKSIEERDAALLVLFAEFYQSMSEEDTKVVNEISRRSKLVIEQKFLKMLKRQITLEHASSLDFLINGLSSTVRNKFNKLYKKED